MERGRVAGSTEIQLIGTRNKRQRGLLLGTRPQPPSLPPSQNNMPEPIAKQKSAPALPPHLDQQLDILLIDNFDSFSYNLYQSICLVNPDISVTVIRNDAIPASAIPLLRIKYLVVSPGPGHPHTDSGISREAIKHFTGKVPVLGVCMGLECLVDVFGGDISFVHLLFYNHFCLLTVMGVDMLERSCTEKYP